MDIFSLLISIVVVGLVCYLLWWLVGFIGLPEPFNKVAQVIIALFAVIYLIGIVTGNAPMVPILRLNRP